ncbi:MAG: Transcription initiation factor IIB [Promethearchaeota archaeon]|nr:MAG: Transcription initiation factor IIB [Candidatus Lokiarchaeota archaeon]
MKSNENGWQSNNKVEGCCEIPNITESNGFYVCMNCGATHSRIIDDSPRRAYTQEEIKKRKITERVLSPIGPRTIIRGNKDAQGNLLNPKYKTKFYRLAKIHRSLITSFERNLWTALPSLHTIQKKIGLPERVAKDALRIYTEAVKKKLTMGRSIDTLLCAAIFCAIRINGIPHALKEITENAQVSEKKVIKNYQLILLKVLPELNLKVKHFDSVDYINKFNDQLGLSMKCRNSAIELINKAKSKGFVPSGKDPKGIASAALYMISKKYNENRTQREICECADITEVTLRLRVKEISQFLEKE